VLRFNMSRKTKADPERAAVRTPRLSESFRSNVYTLLQSARGRPLARCIAELRKTEQLQQAEFDKLVCQRISQTLEHARSQVSLYRTGPWRNIPESSAARLDDWPVLEKSVLQTRFDEMLSQEPPPRFETLRTSGTTGEPTRIASSYLASTYGWAHRYRALQWHGIPIGARSLRLTHDRRPLRDAVLGQKCVWPVDTPEALGQAMDYLVNKRPTLVAGTPSALFYLARRLHEEGVSAPLAPFARVGGEQLYSFQRDQIESCLCARAINSYGTTETGALAGECPAGSMHVYAEHIHMEIFRGDAPALPGEFGDVVVTSLYNLAMPLIRYRVGDKGRLSRDPCTCGLPYPVLTDLQARADDIFVMSDGSREHSSVLVERLGKIFESEHGDLVRQFQLQQKNGIDWEALVQVPESVVDQPHYGPGRAAIQDVVTRIIRQAAGPECDVAVGFVAQLPRKDGKFRYYRTARSDRSAAHAAP